MVKRASKKFLHFVSNLGFLRVERLLPRASLSILGLDLSLMVAWKSKLNSRLDAGDKFHICERNSKCNKFTRLGGENYHFHSEIETHKGVAQVCLR